MKYIKTMLIGLLAIIIIGYHNLNTNASDSLDKGIYYDNIAYTDNIILDGVNGVTINYSANLVKPGDYYELYFDVVNATNYDVEVTDCIYNSDDDYISYELTYEDGGHINSGDIIKKGEKVRVRYRVLYKTYITEDSYTFDTSFSILYGQVI